MNGQFCASWNVVCLDLDMKINKNSFRNFWKLTSDSVNEFLNDKVLKLSAALAYYTIFSLPSMLIVIIGLCSIFFGRDAVQGEVFSEISGFVGPSAAKAIQDILKNTTLNHDNILTTVIGVITLLFAATGMFGEIQDSINAIWGLEAKPKKGFVKLLLNRLASFLMVIVLGFILLVLLILNALLEGLLHRLEHYFSQQVIDYFFVLDYTVMILVTTVLFASILKVLPDAKIEWRDV